jgi:Histidine kinase
MNNDRALALQVTHPQPLALAFAAWRAIPARHVVVAMSLGLAWGLANTLGWWLASGTTDVWQTMAHFVYETELPMLLLLLGIAAADALTRAGPPRIAPYAVAAIVAAVGGELLFVVTAPLLGLASCSCTMDPWAKGARSANMLPDSLIICGFITASYCYRRRGLERIARLRSAELERAGLTRQTMESRLQAMQAYIEPQFLFDTLSQVGRLHATDASGADRMLNELIAYLRAALPHLNETTSTLEKECELAFAYVNIQKLRHPDRLSFACEIATDVRNARMPPMVLMPLVDHAIHDGLETTSLPVSLRISIDLVADKLRLALRQGGAGLRDGSEAIASIRERLQALYGDAAHLDVRAGDGPETLVVIEIPYERAHRGPR